MTLCVRAMSLFVQQLGRWGEGRRLAGVDSIILSRLILLLTSATREKNFGVERRTASILAPRRRRRHETQPKHRGS